MTKAVAHAVHTAGSDDGSDTGDDQEQVAIGVRYHFRMANGAPVCPNPKLWRDAASVCWPLAGSEPSRLRKCAAFAFGLHAHLQSRRLTADAGQ